MTTRMGSFAPVRRRRDDDGFTLIELMVVVLIIAILLAVAIPTFLSARNRAQDRVAQSNLRHAFTDAKALYTDTQDYTQVSIGQLQADEPGLSFHDQTTPSSGPRDISINRIDPVTIVLAVRSLSGNCFLLKEILTGAGGTFYGSHDQSTPCDPLAAGATAPRW